MNVVRLMGGLGNQLFQYAFGQHVQEVTKLPVEYTVDWYRKKQNPRRPFRLDKFNLIVNITKLNIYPQIKDSNSLAKLCLMNQKYFCGYWQDPRYYSEILLERLREEFHVPKEFWTQEFIEWDNYIKSCDNAIALHIRRGDYLAHPNHLVLPLQYYQNALAYMVAMKEDPEVFIFSDDIEWAKEKFEGVNFVELPEDYLEFELMRACKHFIIANSTFSWWAAFLAYNATVIAPNRWNQSHVNGAAVHEKNILSLPWMKINLS